MAIQRRACNRDRISPSEVQHGEIRSLRNYACGSTIDLTILMPSGVIFIRY
jgi:hypothetical protein